MVCKLHKTGQCIGQGILKNDNFTLRKNHTHAQNFQLLKEKAFKRDLHKAVTTSADSFRKCYDKVRPA